MLVQNPKNKKRLYAYGGRWSYAAKTWQDCQAPRIKFLTGA